MTVLRVAGGGRVEGQVRVAGSKNSLPKYVAASLLTEDACLIRDSGSLADFETMLRIHDALGGEALVAHAPDLVELRARTIRPWTAGIAGGFSGLVRASILVAAPLLARLGEALVPVPGGCALGDRPIDYHLLALKKMGAEVVVNSDAIRLRARRLRGTSIRLPYPSIGTTEQILLAGVLASGTTRVENAATEPEIADLAAVLTKMGARINLAGRTIEIEGVDSLRGFDHQSLPDRREAASWAALALGVDGRVTVNNIDPPSLTPFLDVFQRLGGGVRANRGGLEFSRAAPAPRAGVVHTGPYPALLTDWQPPVLATLTLAEGTSRVHETVFIDRLTAVPGLRKLGADIKIRKDCVGDAPCRFHDLAGHSAIVSGPRPLSGTTLDVPDLRAGFGLLIGALAASGSSALRNWDRVEAGYNRLAEKLTALGADVLDIEASA